MRSLLLRFALLLASGMVQEAAPQQPSRQLLAPTPPMGWNSWDCFGYTVREDEVKANADYMKAYMARFGWQYIVVDIEWYTPNVKTHGYIPDPNNVTLDSYGRFLPAPNRFPSSAGGHGFKALADYVHGQGLRFGIHIMRGIPLFQKILTISPLNSKILVVLACNGNNILN